MRTELYKLQATTTISTTTPLPTTMTTKPFPILCDGDWEHFNGHCYLVVRQYKSWDDASAYCTSKNSYLIEIKTDTEREFATELVCDHLYRYVFWIGATDRETTGRFIYQHSQQPVPEKYWEEGQPDNYSGNQHCVGMYGPGMYGYTRSGVVELFDHYCTSLCVTKSTTIPLPTTTTTPLQTTTMTTTQSLPILCDGDWESFDGHCYRVVWERKTWDDASAYCTSKNSYLLEITMDTECQFAFKLLCDHLFGNRETTGRFIHQHSQLPVPEKYWGQVQPNNHCVVIDVYQVRSCHII